MQATQNSPSGGRTVILHKFHSQPCFHKIIFIISFKIESPRIFENIRLDRIKPLNIPALLKLKSSHGFLHFLSYLIFFCPNEIFPYISNQKKL